MLNEAIEREKNIVNQISSITQEYNPIILLYQY